MKKGVFNRQLYTKPLALPKSVPMPKLPQFPLENVYHTPGQTAAIRFFDPYSDEDLEAMRDILRGKEVKKWMDDTNVITQSEYRDWAGTDTNASFLFAVLDARAPSPKAMDYVRGFVYLYSEREEKFRVKRMERMGFIEPTAQARSVLEVSFAARPLKDGIQQGSGVMSSALRQSCLQVEMLLNSSEEADPVIFAFVDTGNIAAQRTLEACGFVRKGQMKYDLDSYEESTLYILNWRLLRKKIREKFLQLQPVL